jgi:hypothetical protein
MATKIIWQEKGILFVHSETVTVDEVLEANNVMYGDPRFDKIQYQISDYTGVTSNLITFSDARVVGKLDNTSSVWNPKMLIAIVSTDENFHPVIRKYFESFKNQGWKGGIFNTLGDAYKWIEEMKLLT